MDLNLKKKKIGVLGALLQVKKKTLRVIIGTQSLTCCTQSVPSREYKDAALDMRSV